MRADAAIAAGFALAAIAWIVVDRPPGGRWLAVHLFTLGVVTPLIVAFSQHQAGSLLGAPARPRVGLRVLLVGGALTLATGVAVRSTPVVAVGATVTGAAVTLSWWWLRAARKRAGTARFRWVVRAYERAHGAFLHGALLGALLGTGVIPAWAYVEVRQAHLHAMVLGFAAITLLATAFLYGPMLLRAQLEPDAAAGAERRVRHAATSASVVVLALLAAAAPAPWGTAGRWLAALGLAVVGVLAAGIALPLTRTVRRKGARSPLAGVLLTAALWWLSLAAAADAVVVASGAWRQLDAVGLMVLTGGLAQAIVATLLHVTATWLPRARRLRVWRAIDALPVWTAALPQVLVLALVLRAVRW